MGLREGLVTRKGNSSLTTFSLWELRDDQSAAARRYLNRQGRTRGGLVTSLYKSTLLL